jgi:hypothetical protein
MQYHILDKVLPKLNSFVKGHKLVTDKNLIKAKILSQKIKDMKLKQQQIK